MEDEKKIIVVLKSYTITQDYDFFGSSLRLDLLFYKNGEKLQPEDLKRIIDFIKSFDRKEIN